MVIKVRRLQQFVQIVFFLTYIAGYLGNLLLIIFTEWSMILNNGLLILLSPLFHLQVGLVVLSTPQFWILIAVTIFGGLGSKLTERWISTRKGNKKALTKIKKGQKLTTRVVGVTFNSRQENISKLSIGASVFLRHEADSPHDSNAIKVTAYRYSERERDAFEAGLKGLDYGSGPYEILDDKRFEEMEIGYLNKDLASSIATILREFQCIELISGQVVDIPVGAAPDGLKGVRIQFGIPTLEDDQRLCDQQDEIFFNMTMTGL